MRIPSKDNPFKLGDRVEVIDDNHCRWRQIFIIKDFSDNGIFCRDTEGVVNGLHYNQLCLVQNQMIQNLLKLKK